jgi:hypothetical protein
MEGDKPGDQPLGVFNTSRQRRKTRRNPGSITV